MTMQASVDARDAQTDAIDNECVIKIKKYKILRPMLTLYLQKSVLS
jgi:hypothetical protein